MNIRSLGDACGRFSRHSGHWCVCPLPHGRGSEKRSLTVAPRFGVHIDSTVRNGTGFADELANVLPADLPNRPEVIRKAALHLDLIVEANRQFNLTRITDPREAAIKHVLDSLMPWKLFADASQVVDAGTGAGFPGIPLALVLPDVSFTLSESIGKKAQFVESAVKAIGIPNVRVARARAEELLQKTHVDLVTARAVAPISRAAVLFGTALKRSTRALLYKGPDAGVEISDAQPELRKRRLIASVVLTYELPESSGSRSIVELKSA